MRFARAVAGRVVHDRVHGAGAVRERRARSAAPIRSPPTSHAAHVAAPPRSTISATTSRPFSRRLATTTCPPAAPHASAMPRPTPAAPPVTITVRPARSTVVLTAPSPIRRRRRGWRRWCHPGTRSPTTATSATVEARPPSAGGGRNDVRFAEPGARSSSGTSTVFTVMPRPPHWRAADLAMARTPSIAVTNGTSDGAPLMPVDAVTTTMVPPVGASRPCAACSATSAVRRICSQRSSQSVGASVVDRRSDEGVVVAAHVHHRGHRPRVRRCAPTSTVSAPSAAASVGGEADAPDGTTSTPAARGAHRSMIRPPSAMSVWPVTNALASDSRKPTTGAMSSSRRPSRGTGWREKPRSNFASALGIVETGGVVAHRHRADAVHRDAEAAPLGGRGAADRTDRLLRGGVRGVGRDAFERGVRPERHDAAVTLVAHHRERRLHEPHRALDAGGERHVEVGVEEVLHADRSRSTSPRWRRRRRRCRRRRPRRRRARTIASRSAASAVRATCGAPRSSSSADSSASASAPRADTTSFAPATREVARDAAPDALARAGDDDDLAVQVVDHAAHWITPVHSAPVMTPATSGRSCDDTMPGARGDHRGDGVERTHEGGEAEPAHVAAPAVHLDVDGVRRHALEDDAVPAQGRRVPRPVGCRVLTHPGDVLEHDALLAVLHADEPEPHRADRARGQRSRRGLVRLGRDPLLERVVDRVELEPVPRRRGPRRPATTGG